MRYQYSIFYTFNCGEISGLKLLMVCLIANCLLGWTTISYSENIQNNGVEKLGEW